MSKQSPSLLYKNDDFSAQSKKSMTRDLSEFRLVSGQIFSFDAISTIIILKRKRLCEKPIIFIFTTTAGPLFGWLYPLHALINNYF